MGCAMEIVKYLVFIFNLVFAIVGMALLVVGVIVRLDLHTLDVDTISKVDRSVNVIPTLIIVIGVIIFVTAFFGCCGAIKENKLMLTLYASILLILFLVQVAIGIMVVIAANDSSNEIYNELLFETKQSFGNYSTSPEERKEIDHLQISLKCCGVEGPQYWENEWKNQTYPPSCCGEVTNLCDQESDAYYKDGCASKEWEFTVKLYKIIGFVTFIIAAVEVIGGFFACCLINSVRNVYRRGTFA